jgi:hypothetical protein
MNPKKQFTGWHVHRDIVKLFEDGIINATELVVLYTIDSLVSEDKGCFASNKYLGEKVRLSAVQVSHVITKLKRLGLVIQIAFNGRIRYLETSFSRIDMRKASKFLRKSLVRSNGADRLNSTRLDSVIQPGQIEENKSSVPKGTKGKGGDKSPRPRGNLTTSEKDAKWDRRGGEKLKDILAKHGSTLVHLPQNGKRRRAVRVDTLSKNFRYLREDVGVAKGRIAKVMKWLVGHYDDDYTPKVYKADDFGVKFNQFEDAMKRSQNGYLDREAREEKKAQEEINQRHKWVANVRSELEKLDSDYYVGVNVDQDVVDDILAERLGLPSGSLDAMYV